MELIVSDRGPGLAEGQVATLFQRGARGPASRGSGLGLHVSRTLMRQQGGDLVLREHVDGATFAITLPLAVPLAWTQARCAVTPVRELALAAAEAS